MGQNFSVEFSFAVRLWGSYQKSCPMGSLFLYLLPNVVCMYVCLFVCYKKGSITFDQNNVIFTQKIDDCMGWVINFIQQKTVQI